MNNTRIYLLALVAALVLAPAVLLSPTVATGEEAKAKTDPLPPLSSDEEVAAALGEYKVAFKAKGLRGDDRSAQRDFAMEQLSAFQHKKVVDAFAKNLRHSDEYVRLGAVVHLGSQRALPVYAGKKLTDMMKKYRKDLFFMISAFDTLGKLKYLGAEEQIKDGLRHQDFGVKKAAIAAIGNIGDHRLMYAMLKEVGIDAERVASSPAPDPKSSGGQAEQVGEGYSWEGAEAEVDTGTAGDGDQKAAEKAAKEKAAANEAAAKQKGGGASGGIGGATGTGGVGATGGGGGGGRGGSGRSKQELIHPIKATLSKLTGEDFQDAKNIFKWLRENSAYMTDKVKEVDSAEKAQKASEKARAQKGA